MALHPNAAQSTFLARPIPLVRYVVYALVGHVLLFGAAIAYNSLVQPAAIDLGQKPIKASLVRLGKPREKELLPRKEEEAPPPPKAEEAPPTPVPPPPVPAVPVPGVKPTETHAAKQDGQKKAPDTKNQLFKAFGKASKTPASELEGATDGDARGDSATQEGPRYYGLLISAIHGNYDLPDTIPDQERIHLKALISVSVGRAGQLLRVKVVKSSGNDLYDSAVVAAIKRTAPFPPPPDELRETMEHGVTLECTP